ncbi:MAG TPA: hypothetical protein PK156_33395 [Polyangium sp.]|nr:hypothetical protein [Polyangium sp.]
MYLSLWTTHIGQVTFEDETEPYREILGDPTKEDAVLAFLKKERIESLSLYDLYKILGDATREPALLSFITRARQNGVLEVNAIGDTTYAAWDAIATTQAASKPFDGLVTEIEFWNGSATFQEFTDTLKYVRSLNIPGRTGGEATLGVYTGWPDATQIEGMLPLIDRLYVHVYVKSPDLAYGYGKDRFQLIANANQKLGTNVDVRPIFSAEGVAWSAGSEHFMGDWLSTGSLDEAEAQLLGAWEAVPPIGPVKETGFQYYDYFFLNRYVK